MVGGLISSGTNFLIEWQRSRKEKKKRQEDRDAQELELRNEAYIRFLSINENQVYETNDDMVVEFNPGVAEESIALVLTHGSPMIASIVVHAHPFKSWEELER